MAHKTDCSVAALKRDAVQAQREQTQSRWNATLGFDRSRSTNHSVHSTPAMRTHDLIGAIEA